MNELKNKVVVVTGGSGVLCGAMARHLAQLGCKVGVLGRTKTKVDAVVNAIQVSGGQATSLVVDVLDKRELSEAHQKLNKEFGPCEILINGAGGSHPGGVTSKPYLEQKDINEKGIQSFFDLTPEGVQHVFDLNFQGTFLPTQVFARDMVGKKNCSIVNISSMTAYKPLTKVFPYSGAKAAVSSFTEWLAVHFSKQGIRVNAIAPGFFVTEQNRQLLTNEDGSLTERGQTIIDHTPMGRFGEPEDLLGALEWLCTSASKFVTGIVVPVDGGFMAFGGV